jgi:hypothetical protein
MTVVENFFNSFEAHDWRLPRRHLVYVELRQDFLLNPNSQYPRRDPRPFSHGAVVLGSGIAWPGDRRRGLPAFAARRGILQSRWQSQSSTIAAA